MEPTSAIRLPLLKPVLWVISVVVLLFLLLPSVYVIVWSVKGTSTVGTLGVFSTKWFALIFESTDWRDSFVYSVFIAFVSSSVATISALLYFYFSLLYRRAYQFLGFILCLGPIFFPSVVYALSLRVTFGSFGSPEWLPLIVGHISLLMPIQYFLIESSNELIKIEWIYGAATMGSTHREVLREIVFPLLSKPIFIAFGIGLLFSFDEIVIASLIIDSANSTIPKRMWDTINRQMDPTPAVVATVILLLSVILIFGFYVVGRKKRMLRA